MLLSHQADAGDVYSAGNCTQCSFGSDPYFYFETINCCVNYASNSEKSSFKSASNSEKSLVWFVQNNLTCSRKKSLCLSIYFSFIFLKNKALAVRWLLMLNFLTVTNQYLKVLISESRTAKVNSWSWLDKKLRDLSMKNESYSIWIWTNAEFVLDQGYNAICSLHSKQLETHKVHCLLFKQNIKNKLWLHKALKKK